MPYGTYLIRNRHSTKWHARILPPPTTPSEPLCSDGGVGLLDYIAGDRKQFGVSITITDQLYPNGQVVSLVQGQI